MALRYGSAYMAGLFASFPFFIKWLKTVLSMSIHTYRSVSEGGKGIVI